MLLNLKSRKNKKLEKIKKWQKSYSRKVRALIKNNNIPKKDIADYFLFENLKQKHPGFCQLFKLGNEPCHKGIAKKNFCCLFCACPYYEIKQIEDKIGDCLLKTHKKYCTTYSDETLDCTNCSFVHDVAWARSNVEKAIKK